MRGSITKRAVDALKPGARIYDTEVRGFEARALPSGAVSYSFRYRVRETGARHTLALGMHGNLTPDEARRLAKQAAGRVADGENPAAERKAVRAAAASKTENLTVSDVIDDFVKRYVVKNGLRSRKELISSFDRRVKPVIGHRPIHELRRGEIIEMLDDIAEAGSERLADTVLAQIRKCFNWYATRDETFTPPIVKGMARTKLRDLTRHRTLNDAEIREIWAALDGFQPEPYARIVRVLLLTGARLNEVARLRWDEIAAGAWTIPAERYKAKVDHTLPIVPAVEALIGAKPTKSAEFVFSTQKGTTPFSGFSKAKAATDRRIHEARKAADPKAKPMPNWRLHDLRRTARSLMSRAGVSSDIAERVLGHVMPGVRGVYDKHEYIDQKRDALERLGAAIERILNPPPGNVIELGTAKKSARGGTA